MAEAAEVWDENEVEVEIEFPDKLVPIFEEPRGAFRYRGAYGGRGSGKSMSFALLACLFGYAEKLRILCTRELQVSIKESFYAELVNAINEHAFLRAHYTIMDKGIYGANGTEFIFRGLRHNISGIKSMAQIDICIIEEAEDVPEASLRDLGPTVRAPNSEIWLIWNPSKKGSPVDKRFRLRTPRRAGIVELNYPDNPFFTKVLNEQRKEDQELLEPAMYAHVWEGAYLENSEAQILHDKVRVSEFTPQADWEGPYHGMDFGFANDPTTAVRCWVNPNTRALLVEYEAYKVGLELDDTADYVNERIPEFEDYESRADSARPESISYLKRHGIPNIKAVLKWPGSVADGIAHLRSYSEIVIHPRCKETIRESRLYSYKRDKATNEVQPEPIDLYNHCIDAIRYAVQKRIKRAKRKARVL
jgi:phage terminase large subunit